MQRPARKEERRDMEWGSPAEGVTACEASLTDDLHRCDRRPTAETERAPAAA